VSSCNDGGEGGGDDDRKALELIGVTPHAIITDANGTPAAVLAATCRAPFRRDGVPPAVDWGNVTPACPVAAKLATASLLHVK
jgi:hypothetical protein